MRVCCSCYDNTCVCEVNLIEIVQVCYQYFIGCKRSVKYQAQFSTPCKWKIHIKTHSNKLCSCTFLLVPLSFIFIFLRILFEKTLNVTIGANQISYPNILYVGQFARKPFFFYHFFRGSISALILCMKGRCRP